MAIVRLGPIVSAISGAIGSVVFIAGGRSTVARLRPVTLYKTSTFLDRSKTRFQNLQRHWSTLTSLQQDAWRTAAGDIPRTNSLGQASPMSGFNYFVMTNRIAFPNVFSIVEEPVQLLPNDVIVNPTASFSASGSYTVSIDNPTPDDPLRMEVYGWPFWRDTASREVARLVWISELTQPGTPLQFSVRSRWQRHFGPLSENQRFAVGLKARVSRSPFVHMTVIRGTVAA